MGASVVPHDDNSHPRPPHAVIHRAPAWSNERGNTLVLVLALLVAGGVIAAAVLSNLLGEIQGAFSYRYAVGALSAAEAGVHYAAARINGTGGPAYTGETDRILTHPTLGNIGTFDVAVRCFDGTVPSNPNPCGTSPQPTTRVLTATGFVPNKTLSLGRRTVVSMIRETPITALNFAVCGVDGVTFAQDVVTYGNVGSNATITLSGPPGDWARTQPYNGQAGDATAGGTVNCSGTCGPPVNQVAGTTTNNYPGGQVCPVLPAFTCNPGLTDIAGGSGSSYTISAANGNTVLRDVTLGSNSTLTFETASATEILTVQMRTLIIGQNGRVRVTGPGKVVLHLAGRMEISQGTLFGVDALNANIPPGNFVLRSCSADAGTDYAVEFHQTGAINAIIFAPNGRVQLDQASLSNGAIQSRTVQFDRNTSFSYNNTNLSINSGVYNTLTSWREQP